MIMELLTDASVQLQNGIFLSMYSYSLRDRDLQTAELVFHLCTIFSLLLNKRLYIPHMIYILF